MIVASALSILDIAALMILALSMSAILTGSDINIPLTGLSFGPDKYIYVVGTISAVILLKSVLSLVQQWFATRKFAIFELSLGQNLFKAYLQAPWVDRLSRSSSELVRMADVGIAAINAGLILPLMGLAPLIVSAITIVIFLFVTDPLTAAITLLYFGLIALLTNLVLSKKTVEAGKVNRSYSYKVAGLMTDMVGALKEVTLRNKLDEVSEVVQANRFHATRARANIQFLGAAPRFIMDVALIGGILVISGVGYAMTGEISSILNSLVLFTVSATRLIPALTGFQGTLNVLNANASQIRAILRDLEKSDEYIANKEIIGQEKIASAPRLLSINNISFRYPTGESDAVTDFSLDIPMGSSVGIVGESGSGKSTLVDIILGLLEPQKGEILVNEQALNKVLADWRSLVGYVPQEVSLFDGTIEQNVALTWSGEIDREKVIDCLKKAQLWDTVQARPGGLQANVGERGIGLSGGQRQRMGIARALYGDPVVLILDEATSALDTKTESEVAKAVNALRGDVTIISIAHRLSTVKNVDMLIYMENSRKIAQGTFEEVVQQVPAFATQAFLAGLIPSIPAVTNEIALNNAAKEANND